MMPLRSFVARCRLGTTVSVGGSGVAERCSDRSDPWSFPSTSEGDVCGGVGWKFCVVERRLSDDGAALDSGDEVVGVPLSDGDGGTGLDVEVERTLARRGLKRIGCSRNFAISILYSTR